MSRNSTTIMHHRSSVDFWRRVGVGSALLVFKALVYAVVLHYVLVWFKRFLTRYEGAEQAVSYFFSQATGDCISATLPVFWPIARSWIGSAVGRARDIVHGGRKDPAPPDGEDLIDLMGDLSTQ